MRHRVGETHINNASKMSFTGAPATARSRPATAAARAATEQVNTVGNFPGVTVDEVTGRPPGRRLGPDHLVRFASAL
jgi:hypothetical protein